MNWAKQSLREIFLEVLKHLDLKKSFDNFTPILEKVNEYHFLNDKERKSNIRIVAIGKAAPTMVEEVIRRCDLDVVSGIISTPVHLTHFPKGLQVYQGGHPLPNELSLQAAYAALQLLTNTYESDLVLFLISGGGSALMDGPIMKEISFDDLRLLHHSLITCGAGIEEVNTVRKHLSCIKGGRLALAAYPSRQITLYVSDVPEGKESYVASGPTMPDESTIDDMYHVISQYKLANKFPDSIVRMLRSRQIPETPKHVNQAFQNAEWHCLISNGDALKITKECCERRGWKCIIETAANELPVQEATEYLLTRLKNLKDLSGDTPVCVIAGGEVRVAVSGNGIGGRNQAFVLECVERISEKRIAILSAGTDGIDGNSYAAGAVADGNSFKRANDFKLDTRKYLANFDSSTFFSKLGDDIVVGATGNNVRDVRILLYW